MNIHPTRRWALAASLLLVVGTLQAQPAQPASAASAPAGPPVPYVSPDTPQGTGPHPAIMQTAPGLATHTLYRPVRLDMAGLAKLPVVVWGNGACVNVGNRFRYFLTEIASHGFVVLALGPIGPSEAEYSLNTNAIRGRPAPGSPTAKLLAEGKIPGVNPASGNRPSDTTAAQMIEAIDWAIAENQRPGSLLAGRLDTSAVAVMGQSCGGLQAIAAARDPRVKTLGVWNSGLFSDDSRAWAIAAADVRKADLATLRQPAIYITGEPSEVAFKNADDDVDRIHAAPVFRAWRDATGHSGTYRQAHGGAFAPVAVAWLKWQLQGDAQAARLFKGADCGLCRQPDWHVRKKRIDD